MPDAGQIRPQCGGAANPPQPIAMADIFGFVQRGCKVFASLARMSRMREAAFARVGRSVASGYSAPGLICSIGFLEQFLCTAGERRRVAADPRLIARAKFEKKNLS